MNPQKTETTPKAQVVELIRASQNILLLTHTNPDGDAIGSLLAMRQVLEKLGKQVEAVAFGRVPKSFSFLAGFDQLKDKVASSNELMITIDTRQTGEDLRLGHKKQPDEHQVTIVISTDKGSLLPEDVTVTRARPKYDLILILDCSAADRVSSLYAEMPELFYETPTVSIDHHATNTFFAKVNWVDMTASSTAEMLVSLIESLGRDEPLLDADVATALLTGLTTDTGSFQNASTTPKSLTVAAQLVAAGARQQEIIDRIFRTKPLSTLKLWGKILSNIREEAAADKRFVWAAITEAEIKEVDADPTETTGLIDELLKAAADVDFVLLLSDRDGSVHGSFRSVNRAFNVAEIAKSLGGGGHTLAAGFEKDGTINERAPQIIEAIKAHLSSPSS